ncbi:3-oxoadipate enol-lactonase [Corynebacterium breve]|uniref:3-oxoadipate enol-lactonase n=1 Tax=Corynebacterium breve TaxID=3049799 RepID=A0ABY8VBY5_9CORY|nr:3-oxoadipate enol-lactonase [Corynebacterium breve]WIM67185.1 3-oxoadipate enol-lactonase [Corynebacterium breve]
MTNLNLVQKGEETNDKVVVFVGSIASTTEMWAPQLDALAADYRVIAVDHRGHGGSPLADVAEGEASIAMFSEDILSALSDAGVEDFAVVGLSLGGAVAQYLAAHSPRVTKAVFACTAAYFGGPEKWEPRAELTRAEGMAPMVDAVVSLWLTEDFRDSHPEVEQAAKDMVLSVSGDGYAQCSDALAKWDFRDELSAITCPVLTIAGELDESTPPATVAAIAEGISGPKQSVVVPGAHVPTLEAPEEFTRALRDFLR